MPKIKEIDENQKKMAMRLLRNVFSSAEATDLELEEAIANVGTYEEFRKKAAQAETEKADWARTLRKIVDNIEKNKNGHAVHRIG